MPRRREFDPAEVEEGDDELNSSGKLYVYKRWKALRDAGHTDAAREIRQTASVQSQAAVSGRLCRELLDDGDPLDYD